LADLFDAVWLMNPSHESSSQLMFNCFAEHGLPAPTRVVECPSYAIAHSLIQGSDLIASMPEQLLGVEWSRDLIAVLPIR
ncbi:LysR family transcriptional regulator, partial [Burkholderia pseudomallei]